MTPRKDIAEFLRLALRFGLLDTAAVERWVDTVIAAEPVVVYPFTELAAASSLRRGVVDDLLDSVAGESNRHFSGRMAMALVRRRLGAGEMAPETAARLAWEAGLAGWLSEAETHDADWLDDAISLALSGACGTVAEMHRDVVDFFDRYGEYDELIPEPVESQRKRQVAARK